jgi:hypothetical protein
VTLTEVEELPPRPCNHCGGPVVEYQVRGEGSLASPRGELMTVRKCVNRCDMSESLAGAP